MMNVASEMAKIKTLDELHEFVAQHGMGIALQRVPSSVGEGDEAWFVLATIKIVRAEGKVESQGQGKNFTSAIMDAARKIDKMLALGR